jgi:type IV pilus assembly protein PilP
LLLCIILLVAPFVGCGDDSESEAPQKPPELRRKIAVPRKPIAQAIKPEDKRPGRPLDDKDRGKAAKEAKARAKESVEPLPPDKKDLVQPPKSDFLVFAEGVTKRPDFFYDPRGKHDPFESLLEMEAEHIGIAPSRKKVEKKRLPLTPLQRIGLSQLKLVAIVISPGGNKALVEEPSGKGYVITKGTYIGQNYERVKSILKDRVIVEGEIEDFIAGSTKLQTTELKLQKKVGDV